MSLFSALSKKPKSDELPLLPLRELVLFPHTMIPVFLSQKSAVAAVEEASRRDKRVFAVCRKTGAGEDSTYETGCVARLVQQLKLPDGTTRVLLEGEYRAKRTAVVREGDCVLVRTAPLGVPDRGSEGEADAETAALVRAVQKSFAQYADLSKKISVEASAAVEHAESPERLSNLVSNALPVKVDRKVALLSYEGHKERLGAVLEALELENEIIGIQRKISGKVKTRMDKTQREYILNEQLKEINRELGKDGGEDEFNEIERAVLSRNPPQEVLAKARKELSRLRKLQAMSPEAGVLRGYLEWIADLPWSETSPDSRDLALAERILDEDHFDMRKAKERIVEFIAVRQLTDAIKGPILCFVGAPGTGKTSLGRSVARALGRRFVRISLGGVRDEAEIRGHRKTYVGALPGKIVQSMRKAGTMNPVFLLDEIDKLSNDFRGDPASALLEVLDPEQNATFTDHYLEVPFDLSKVLFIATANSLHTIPYPLLDRMEVIEIPGYGEREKLAIAKNFIVPKQLAENGLGESKTSFTDQAILDIIRYYTMESGVRSLEREIARCVRRVAREAVAKGYGIPVPAADPGAEAAEDMGMPVAVAAGSEGAQKETAKGAESSPKALSRFKRAVAPKDLEKLLGRKKHRTDVVFGETRVGVCYGLAWTETGGTILPVECVRLPGSGELILTGNLGDVMKESARAALSYLKSVSASYALTVKDASKFDFHIHVPEGAIPKDGPSAGVTLASALLSVLCERAPLPGVAMTGELTLTGRVLAIGGLKEKLLAAVRVGMKTALVPKANEDELAELSADLGSSIDVKLVETADEVFAHLFPESIRKK
jgi:ATP-dependent Lon protease